MNINRKRDLRAGRRSGQQINRTLEGAPCREKWDARAHGWLSARPHCQAEATALGNEKKSLGIQPPQHLHRGGSWAQSPQKTNVGKNMAIENDREIKGNHLQRWQEHSEQRKPIPTSTKKSQSRSKAEGRLRKELLSTASRETPASSMSRWSWWSQLKGLGLNELLSSENNEYGIILGNLSVNKKGSLEITEGSRGHLKIRHVFGHVCRQRGKSQWTDSGSEKQERSWATGTGEDRPRETDWS